MNNDAPVTSNWEQLEQIVETGDGIQIEQFLRQLPDEETAHTITRLTEQSQTRLLELLPAEYSADLMEALSDVQAADIIEELPAQHAAAIVDQMTSDEQADLLGELDVDDAQAILDRMSPEEARDVRLLSKYGSDTAGGVMVTEFIAFPETVTVEKLITYFRSHVEQITNYVVQYVYVLKEGSRELAGVVRIRDVLLAPAGATMKSIMIKDPAVIQDDETLDQMQVFFDLHSFHAVPVIDGHSNLLGVVRRADVEESLADRADKALLRFGGIITGEELRSMPVISRAARRLMYLCPNIVLNMAAACVIAMFLPVLEQVAALMIFLPILSDMSGCSGNQAIAVSMRELSLGLVKPYEVIHVLSKEIAVGLINGVVLGSILFAIAFAMRGNPMLGVVVGSALAINSLIAVSIGGTIPLILKILKVDPALASGPILTTITDIAGFMIALSLATVMMSRLV